MNRDKIKDVPGAIILLAVAGATIIFIILNAASFYLEWSIHAESYDLSNWATIIVEIGIGIILAISLFIYSDIQQKRITQILTDQEQQHKNIQ